MANGGRQKILQGKRNADNKRPAPVTVRLGGRTLTLGRCEVRRLAQGGR